MTTIFDERGKEKLILENALEDEFAILDENLGKKKAHRIYRKDKETFRVHLEGIGSIPSVSTLLFEEAHGGVLLFWAHKSIAFRTESLFGKVIHMNIDDKGDITIKFSEDLKVGMD